MLRKIYYTTLFTLILANPSYAANKTISGIRTDIAIITGIVALTIVAALGEMLLEVANKGKIKLYVGIVSTLMVLGIVFGYFISIFMQLVKASRMF